MKPVFVKADKSERPTVGLRDVIELFGATNGLLHVKLVGNDQAAPPLERRLSNRSCRSREGSNAPRNGIHAKRFRCDGKHFASAFRATFSACGQIRPWAIAAANELRAHLRIDLVHFDFGVSADACLQRVADDASNVRTTCSYILELFAP